MLIQDPTAVVNVNYSMDTHCLKSMRDTSHVQITMIYVHDGTHTLKERRNQIRRTVSHSVRAKRTPDPSIQKNSRRSKTAASRTVP